MRSISGSQSRGSILVAVVFLCSAVFHFPGAALSIGQERSGQVGYLTKSFPAGNALAKIEADGHSPGEARQLLQERLPKGQPKGQPKGHGRSGDASSTPIVPSARLQDDRIEVQGSHEYIDSVYQRLINIEEFGLQQLLYTVLVVEVPTDKANAIIENWNSLGGCVSTRQAPNSGNLLRRVIAPVSLSTPTTTSTTSELRISGGLKEAEIDEIVEFGNVVQSPQIAGENGAEVVVRVGRDVQFVSTYEPVIDENGNGSATMKPVVGTVHDGITLGLTGTLDDGKENVQLGLNFTDTKLNGMGDPFTFETNDGPLTVQQPEVASSGVQTRCNVPVNQTIAVCSGPSIRESVVERGVPLIGRVPYLGKLFRYTAKRNESITTIILVRWQEQSGDRLPI